MKASSATKSAAKSSVGDRKAHGAREDAPRVVVAEFVAAATSAQSLPAPTLPEFAFAGRSNVGKSSLLNAAMQRKNLVRTSRTPGCTRAINVFVAKLDDGFTAHLVDLPGYGYAKRAKSERGSWGPMLEGYLRDRATLRGIVLLVDVRRGVEDDDLQLVEFARSIDRRVLLVATKIDKVARAARLPALVAIEKRAGERALPFSAVTGEGRAVLWRKLADWTATS